FIGVALYRHRSPSRNRQSTSQRRRRRRRPSLNQLTGSRRRCRPRRGRRTTRRRPLPIRCCRASLFSSRRFSLVVQDHGSNLRITTTLPLAVVTVVSAAQLLTAASIAARTAGSRNSFNV